MYDLPKDQMTDAERVILRRLRVWIVALAVACVVAGIGIGALLAGKTTRAQGDSQIARAPEALSASFVEIAKHVEPAVVNIDTVTTAPDVASGDSDEDEDQSSRSMLDNLRRQTVRPARGVGSGFIVDPKGFILTNQHVVQGATRINVRLQSGEQFRGKVVGIDDETDLAVVKVESPHDLPVVKLGDSDGVQVGDWVLAIGSPFGLDQTVTAGIISKKERETPYFTSFQRFLQTDAAINRGNSGGPLVNMRGEVIGVNSQIATSTGDYNGIGFALPANEAAFVYKQIVAQGRVRRGYLGIFLDSVKSEYARVYGLQEARGAVVMDVRDADGPAAKAGIQANDVIVEYNGQPVENAQDLINRVASTPVGQSASVVYLRDVNNHMERRTATVTVGERPPSLAPHEGNEPDQKRTPPAAGNSANPVKLGLTLGELTPQIITENHLTGVRGLIVKEVDPGGILMDASPNSIPLLREGDVITRINRVTVTSLAEFQRVVDALKPGDPVVLNVTRYNRETERIEQRIVQFTYQ